MKLELADVDVVIGGRPVLSGIDFTLNDGLTAVMGASGIGKTTLLRVVGGLVKPDAGTCRLDGRAAMVFQDPRLLPWQSALDNAGFALRARDASWKQARTAASVLLDQVGLSDIDVMKLPSALSGGMRQRVAIARALSIEPDLLLLDEPFNALDVGLQADIRGLLARIVVERRLAAILVTHDPLEAMMLADRILVLGGSPACIVVDERLNTRPLSPAQAYGAAADFMKRPEVAELFARSPI